MKKDFRNETNSAGLVTLFSERPLPYCAEHDTPVEFMGSAVWCNACIRKAALDDRDSEEAQRVSDLRKAMTPLIDQMIRSQASNQKVIQWLAGDDTGASSKSLAFAFLGVEDGPIHAPLDPSDLGCCLRLIRLVPEVKTAMVKLAVRSATWKIAFNNWDNLAECMEAEVGIDFEKGDLARITWHTMKDLGL